MDVSIQIIDDNNDEDDDVMIIDNPHPKPPAQVVVLCDSDDDDENITKEKKQTNSPNNNQNKHVETGKVTCSDVINLDDSDSSCIRVNDSLMNDKNKQMKVWYEKYKSPQSPRYTCPECLAALSSVYMIDRHIQARHPKSSHRFTKCSGQPCNLDVLSDSESPPSQICKEASNSNSCDTETPIKEKNCSTAQRLKLTPLEGKRTLNYDNTQDRTRLIQSSDLYQLSHLPPLCPIATTSYTSTITANTTTSFPSEIISSSLTDSKKPGLPLARIKPRMSSSTNDSSVYPATRNPLTVVISSPNDSATKERLVKVNPCHDRLNVIEVDSTDDDTVTHQETCNSIDDSGTHERVVEFILNNSKPQDRSRRNSINTNTSYLSQGNNIVVKRNRRSTRAQMTMVKNSKNDNHDKVSKTVGNNLCDTTSKETNKSKEALPSLSGTSDTSRKRKRDPLLILTDDDSSEQNIPKKRLRGDDLKTQANIKDLPKKFICKYCNKKFTTFQGKANHFRDKHLNQKYKTVNKRKQPAVYVPTDPPALDKLSSMKHIILIDIDNWRKIFESDLKFAPSTFVWAFHGGATSWCPPSSSVLLRHLQEMNCFYLHPKCGNSKDAADFALCVQAGKLDVQLPKEIPFTVLSGDNGFKELQNQLNLSKREVHIVNPHHKTLDNILTILNSIADK